MRRIKDCKQQIIISARKLRYLPKRRSMKNIRFLLIAAFAGAVLSSCSLFKAKYGCPSNGKNVGAEKVLDGNSPKAKKFKA
jgi:hypothetical protein